MRRWHRVAIAATACLLAWLLLPALSLAAPSKHDVENAKARLEALNGELSVLVEEFNLAKIRLDEVEGRLVDTRRSADQAAASAEAASAEASANAATAYTGLGSQFASLLDSSSLSDFSDRLEFMGQLASANTDLATDASNAEQEARWLADELRDAVAERKEVLDELGVRRDAIQSRIEQAREIYESLDEEYRAALAAERRAVEAAAAAQERADAAATATDVGTTTAPAPVPVANGSVDAVIAAARSVIGLPYVFGAADPNIGFDCSGLTMWAWAHAGVSLPHSSTAQYASLPHVDRSDLQPGDLVFSSYGRLGSGVIDHVALYVGGGQTIAASNPSVPVGYRPIDWEAYVGAARPG